jgi:hypothetical protein
MDEIIEQLVFMSIDKTDSLESLLSLNERIKKLSVKYDVMTLNTLVTKLVLILTKILSKISDFKDLSSISTSAPNFKLSSTIQKLEEILSSVDDFQKEGSSLTSQPMDIKNSDLERDENTLKITAVKALSITGKINEYYISNLLSRIPAEYNVKFIDLQIPLIVDIISCMKKKSDIRELLSVTKSFYRCIRSDHFDFAVTSVLPPYSKTESERAEIRTTLEMFNKLNNDYFVEVGYEGCGNVFDSVIERVTMYDEDDGGICEMATNFLFRVSVDIFCSSLAGQRVQFFFQRLSESLNPLVGLSCFESLPSDLFSYNLAPGLAVVVEYFRGSLHQLEYLACIMNDCSFAETRVRIANVLAFVCGVGGGNMLEMEILMMVLRMLQEEIEKDLVILTSYPSSNPNLTEPYYLQCQYFTSSVVAFFFVISCCTIQTVHDRCGEFFSVLFSVIERGLGDEFLEMKLVNPFLPSSSSYEVQTITPSCLSLLIIHCLAGVVVRSTLESRMLFLWTGGSDFLIHFLNNFVWRFVNMNIPNKNNDENLNLSLPFTINLFQIGFQFMYFILCGPGLSWFHGILSRRERPHQFKFNPQYRGDINNNGYIITHLIDEGHIEKLLMLIERFPLPSVQSCLSLPQSCMCLSLLAFLLLILGKVVFFDIGIITNPDIGGVNGITGLGIIVILTPLLERLLFFCLSPVNVNVNNVDVRLVKQICLHYQSILLSTVEILATIALKSSESSGKDLLEIKNDNKTEEGGMGEVVRLIRALYMFSLMSVSFPFPIAWHCQDVLNQKTWNTPTLTLLRGCCAIFLTCVSFSPKDPQSRILKDVVDVGCVPDKSVNNGNTNNNIGCSISQPSSSKERVLSMDDIPFLLTALAVTGYGGLTFQGLFVTQEDCDLLPCNDTAVVTRFYSAQHLRRIVAGISNAQETFRTFFCFQFSSSALFMEMVGGQEKGTEKININSCAVSPFSGLPGVVGASLGEITFSLGFKLQNILTRFLSGLLSKGGMSGFRAGDMMRKGRGVAMPHHPVSRLSKGPLTTNNSPMNPASTPPPIPFSDPFSSQTENFSAPFRTSPVPFLPREENVANNWDMNATEQEMMAAAIAASLEDQEIKERKEEEMDIAIAESLKDQQKEKMKEEVELQEKEREMEEKEKEMEEKKKEREIEEEEKEIEEKEMEKEKKEIYEDDYDYKEEEMFTYTHVGDKIENDEFSFTDEERKLEESYGEFKEDDLNISSFFSPSSSSSSPLPLALDEIVLLLRSLGDFDFVRKDIIGGDEEDWFKIINSFGMAGVVLKKPSNLQDEFGMLIGDGHINVLLTYVKNYTTAFKGIKTPSGFGVTETVILLKVLVVLQRVMMVVYDDCGSDGSGLTPFALLVTFASSLEGQSLQQFFYIFYELFDLLNNLDDKKVFLHHKSILCMLLCVLFRLSLDFPSSNAGKMGSSHISPVFITSLTSITSQRLKLYPVVLCLIVSLSSCDVMGETAKSVAEGRLLGSAIRIVFLVMGWFIPGDAQVSFLKTLKVPVSSSDLNFFDVLDMSYVVLWKSAVVALQMILMKNVNFLLKNYTTDANGQWVLFGDVLFLYKYLLLYHTNSNSSLSSTSFSSSSFSASFPPSLYMLSPADNLTQSSFGFLYPTLISSIITNIFVSEGIHKLYPSVLFITLCVMNFFLSDYEFLPLKDTVTHLFSVLMMSPFSLVPPPSSLLNSHIILYGSLNMEDGVIVKILDHIGHRLGGFERGEVESLSDINIVLFVCASVSVVLREFTKPYMDYAVDVVVKKTLRILSFMNIIVHFIQNYKSQWTHIMKFLVFFALYNLTQTVVQMFPLGQAMVKKKEFLEEVKLMDVLSTVYSCCDREVDEHVNMPSMKEMLLMLDKCLHSSPCDLKNGNGIVADVKNNCILIKKAFE